MRIVLKLALAACVALSPCASFSAYAQAPWYKTLQPYRSSLKVYEGGELCGPFIRNVDAEFEGRPGADIQGMWPEAKLISLEVPDEGSRSFTLDFDHDGDLEVIHVDHYTIGWRYLGIHLYAFASEADYAIAVADKSHYNHHGWLDLDGGSRKPVAGASYIELGEFRSGGSLIQIGDGYYIIEGPSGARSNPSVIQLNAKGGPRPVCEMEIEPPSEYYSAFASQAPFVEGYAAAFGQPSCVGTMGWRGGDSVADPFHDILSRPWTYRQPQPARNTPAISPARDDAIRELRYLSWGARDPQSWEDYLKAKQGRARFVAELRSYYVSNVLWFKMSEAEATETAERAWRLLLDNAYYTHPMDRYELTTLLVGDAAIDLPITPDTPPAEIARIAIEAWLKAHPAGSKVTEYDPGILSSALMIAVETRQPIEMIRQLADRRDEAFPAIGANLRGFPPSAWVGDISDAAERAAATKQAGLDQALTVALGHAGLTNFLLERGANPSAKTNWFLKTPLMYAAQQDQLNAVRLLLSRGADVRAITDGKNWYCSSLDRDHRTALMYAAENASPPVIEAILAAGADVSAKDTKGNSALWYFGRNAKITDSAVRARISARLGG